MVLFIYVFTIPAFRYDLVLNCGGRETIRFDRQQFITSQRTVDTVVWKYIETEEVALIPIDTKVGFAFSWQFNTELWRKYLFMPLHPVCVLPAVHRIRPKKQ